LNNNYQPNFLLTFKFWFNLWILSQKEKFTTTDIKKGFFKKFKTQLDDYLMDELLKDNYLILKHPKNNIIFKRSQYFENRTFKITPTSEEVFKKILIPGHHFIPFHCPEVNSFSCDLLWNKKAIPVINYSLSIRQAYEHYLLTPKAMDLLLSINESNLMHRKDKSNITYLNDCISISVYDMKKFYNHHNFTVGDSILFTVLDWDSGEFDISYAPKSLFQDSSKKEKWIHEMDESLKKVITDYPGMWSPTEQFAYAFFYAPKNNLLEEPLCTISEYLESSQEIQLKHLIYRVFLWTKDETNLNEYIWNMTQNRKFGMHLGLYHDLSCIIDDLDTHFRGPLLHAMVWSELDKGHTVAQDMLINVFPDLPQNIADYPFLNDDQRKYFPKYWKKYIKEAQKRYNPFKDKIWKEIRVMLSEVLIDFYHWRNDVFYKNANCRKPMLAWLQLNDLIKEIETIVIITCADDKKESMLNTDFEVSANIYHMLKSQVMQDITSTITLKVLPALNNEPKPILEENDITKANFENKVQESNKANKRNKTKTKKQETPETLRELETQELIKTNELRIKTIKENSTLINKYISMIFGSDDVDEENEPQKISKSEKIEEAKILITNCITMLMELYDECKQNKLLELSIFKELKGADIFIKNYINSLMELSNFLQEHQIKERQGHPNPYEMTSEDVYRIIMGTSERKKSKKTTQKGKKTQDSKKSDDASEAEQAKKEKKTQNAKKSDRTPEAEQAKKGKKAQDSKKSDIASEAEQTKETPKKKKRATENKKIKEKKDNE